MGYEPGKYHTHDEVCAMLSSWAGKYESLTALESIGETADGKQLLLLTLTDPSTGSHDTKPAFWCDANTHAGEVVGCQCCLHLIHTLLSGWDAGDPATKSLLGTSTVYVLPRISPDGSEYMLTTPYSCRSSPVLFDPSEQPGWIAEDVNGDGACLLMRQVDPAGDSKCSSADPRIMVQRAPYETGDDGTTFYRLVPEGIFKDYADGAQQSAAPGFSLDLNRQFPYQWAAEGIQAGAGSYPSHLPQARHVVMAICARNNICALQTCKYTAITWSLYGSIPAQPCLSPAGLTACRPPRG
jgi:murein tripeptide amidase MpaA